MKYYTFEIDGQKVGYYEEKNEGGVLYSNAYMVMNGEKFENPFWIKHNKSKVLAYKAGEDQYLEFNQKDNVYPSSAIALLLPKVSAGKSFEYKSFNEGEAKVIGSAILEMIGDKIEEKVNGKLTRHFIIKKNNVVSYCWGGTAFSHQVATKAEAIKDTPWE